MWKNRVILLLVGSVLIILIYTLPKGAVDNDEGDISTEKDTTTTDFHQEEIAPEKLQEVAEFKTKLLNSDNIEKSSIFADSLAEAFRTMNQWDSAAYYLGELANRFNTRENMFKAGEAYFQAQGFALNQNEVENLGGKARVFFEKVLAEDPGDLDAKVKVGLTYIASSNPMQGILVLREVLESNPDHELALYNMGVLSMQSSQWEKAEERFIRLLEYHPGNSRAHFYLGLTYIELGRTELAKKHLLKVKELEKDPEVLANVDSYLEDINN